MARKEGRKETKVACVICKINFLSGRFFLFAQFKIKSRKLCRFISFKHLCNGRSSKKLSLYGCPFYPNWPTNTRPFMFKVERRPEIFWWTLLNSDELFIQVFARIYDDRKSSRRCQHTCVSSTKRNFRISVFKRRLHTFFKY